MTDNMGLVPMSAELTMFYHDFTSSLAFAAQQERDRIIELLESDPEELIDAGGGLRAGYETAIQLIKGEQK